MTMMSNIDKDLLSLLPSILTPFDVDPEASLLDSSVIKNALLDIAPAGFSGIEFDNYYIIRLLFEKQPSMFNEVQLKQWQSYVTNWYLTFKLFLIINESTSLLNFDCFYTQTKNNKPIMNLSFPLFIKAKNCSNNTFGRLIHVMNHFSYTLWETAFFHMAHSLNAQNIAMQLNNNNVQ